MTTPQIKSQFPILQKKIHHQPFVYLDSGASSQKPLPVIEAMQQYYLKKHANIHRGLYQLSQEATDLFESARKKVQHFIGAKHAHEIIFVRGTTEAINLVAQSFGRSQIQSGDEIILSVMEHHSNIVPWQLLAKAVGATIKVVPLTESGELNLNVYQRLFSSRTKIVAMSHVSNVLGTINSVEKIIEIAHSHQVPVLLDGAQAVSHLPVNVSELNCDFYVFSSHKMYGPTGIGVLYGKTELLEKMPPWQGGGDMIERVSFLNDTTFAPLPAKFEAGTPAIAEAVGLAAAIDWLKMIGFDTIQAHEKKILTYAHEQLLTFPQLTILGALQNKVGVIAFTIEHIHPHDIGTILDQSGVAIRAGHHCAMPLMEFFKLPACARVSLGVYNSFEDIDALIAGLKIVQEVFAV